MDFKINKQRANRTADIARMAIDKNYDGGMPLGMICVVSAFKRDENDKGASYEFSFQNNNKQPYASQIIVNEDMSIIKICEVIE